MLTTANGHDQRPGKHAHHVNIPLRWPRFSLPKLLVRTEVVFRKAVSRHTSVLLRRTQCCIVRAGPLRDRWGRVLLCVTDRLLLSYFVCATARAERWYITIIIAVITVPDEPHCLERTEREMERVRKRNSTSDPCGLYSSYFIPAVIDHLPTRDGPQTLTSLYIHLLHSLLQPYTFTQTYQKTFLSVTPQELHYKMVCQAKLV